MQDTIMQKLKEEIVKTENTLRKIASENIISRQENTIEHARTMQNIELITRISRLIEDADFKQHKNDLVQKGINLMPLNSNFKSKHPVAVYIDDQPHSAKYLRDIARIVCAHLLRVKRQEMLAEASNFKTLVRGDCYASFEKSDVACDDPDEIKSGRGDVLYIDSCRMVVNQMGLLRRMMALVGFPETSVTVEVSDTYIRKRREVKVPQRKSLTIDLSAAESVS